MIEAPRISVVIPVHNGIEHLPDAIESVGAQRYPDIELILVDDGSTDASGSFIDEVPGAIAIHQPNCGPGAARNTGIAAATGTLVAFLDQDDIWAPHKLDRQLAHLMRHPHLGYVLARHRLFLHQDAERPGWVRDRHLEGAVSGFVFGTMLAHRHVFDTVGLLNRDLRYGGDDVDWFARAADDGVAHEMLDEVLLDRRVHDSNLSRMTMSFSRELLGVIRQTVQRRRFRQGTADG